MVWGVSVGSYIARINSARLIKLEPPHVHAHWKTDAIERAPCSSPLPNQEWVYQPIPAALTTKGDALSGQVLDERPART